MIEYEFHMHFDEVADALDDAVIRALETCGLAGERFAKENVTAQVKHSNGPLRNSISHAVVPDEKAVYIGARKEYATYVELGTGMYYPGGRRGWWVYVPGSSPREGNGKTYTREEALGIMHALRKKGLDAHITCGQPPKPFIKPAVADHGEEYRTIIKNALENG